jgi:type II secretory pathway predicted ATPase ExeA
MQRELANSGLSPEEIMAKTMLLQKAMQGDNSPAFINKTMQNALNAANLSPSELAKVFGDKTMKNERTFTNWSHFRPCK